MGKRGTSFHNGGIQVGGAGAKGANDYPSDKQTAPGQFIGGALRSSASEACEGDATMPVPKEPEGGESATYEAKEPKSEY